MIRRSDSGFRQNKGRLLSLSWALWKNLWFIPSSWIDHGVTWKVMPHPHLPLPTSRQHLPPIWEVHQEAVLIELSWLLIISKENVVQTYSKWAIHICLLLEVKTSTIPMQRENPSYSITWLSTGKKAWRLSGLLMIFTLSILWMVVIRSLSTAIGSECMVRPNEADDRVSMFLPKVIHISTMKSSSPLKAKSSFFSLQIFSYFVQVSSKVC